MVSLYLGICLTYTCDINGIVSFEHKYDSLWGRDKGRVWW